MAKRLVAAFFLFGAFGMCFSNTAAAPGETVEPITQLKKLYLDTELVQDGVAKSVIYHPPSPEYESAAKELARAVEQQFGVPLPTKPDDAQRTWSKEKQNILALGNLGNSLLLRWLYYRSFIAPLSWQKRRLQTIHDPWGEGRNVVMLGGVDLENVKANFPRLLQLLQTPRKGTVILPRTFDPALTMGKELKAQLEEYLQTLDKMPLNYPAYHAGWVCKHYLSDGFDELVPLYRNSIARLNKAKDYVHLYLFRECEGWDVIEESPALTDADRLMITNFFRNSVADEKEGIGYVRKIMRHPRLIQGNHPSQAACGVMVAADYLRKYYPSELHEKWYREALAFFEPYRTKGSYLGDDEAMQAASITNIMNAVYRIADDPAEHPFLKRVLDRLMPNSNNFGLWPAYGDVYAPYRFGAGFFELGAHIYGSPEYLWMAHFINNASTTAPAKIPTEQPKAAWWPLSITPRQPKGLIGLQWAEPDDILFSMARPAWAKANNVTKDDLFGRAAFRAGLDPQDDYLLLDGVHLGHAYDDQNGILEYSTLGRTFLVSLDYCYGAKLSAHNVVAVSVDGMADASPPLVAVRRLWADLPSFAATRTFLYTHGEWESQKLNSPSADWERNILWLKNRFFLVFDRVIARREGLHSAVAFWRMVGEPRSNSAHSSSGLAGASQLERGERSDLPNGIEMKQQAGDTPVHFRLTVGGMDHFTIGREKDPQATYLFSRYGKQPPPLDTVPPVIHMLKSHKAKQLKAGESFTLWTGFGASSAHRPNEIACRSVAPNAVRVDLNQKPMLAALGPIALDKLSVEAELSLIAEAARPDEQEGHAVGRPTGVRLCVVAGRKLSLDGRTIFESEAPISFEWNPANGVCEIESQCATKALFLGQTVEVPKGRSTQRLRGGNLSERLASILKSLPTAPEPPPEAGPPRAEKQPTHLPAVADRLQIVAQRAGQSGVECLWAGRLGAPGEAVLVGRQDGSVEALSGDALNPLWTYRCERVVNSMDVGDLDGDGAPEIAVGSDDHYLRALTRDGRELWKWKPPFDELKARIAYCQWLWPEPFVKKVAVHDLDRDGKAEIVAGTGMNTFAVNGKGQEIWAFRKSKGHCPCMRAIVFLDVNDDGVEEPVGGASDMWYDAPMWAIGPGGEELPIGPKGELPYFASDGWCSGVKVALAEDLLGVGKKSLAYGTRLGGLWCYPNPNDWKERWYRRFGDEIDLLAALRYKDNMKLIIAAGGDTKWVTAFDPKGDRLWSVYLDGAVTAMAAARLSSPKSNAAQDRLYVGCEDGFVYELDAMGRLSRSVSLPGKPRIIAAHPQTGVAVGTEQGNVYLVR